MVMDWADEANADFREIFRVEIGDVAGGAVVLDEILVVLEVGSGELRKRAQVVGCAGIGLQGTGRGWARRIVAARAWCRWLGPSGARKHSRHHRNKHEAHVATPARRATSAGTWQSLRFRPADRDGRELPGFRWRRAAGPV